MTAQHASILVVLLEVDTVMLRRDRWLAAGDDDERMCDGFEDGDCFLSLLACAGGMAAVVRIANARAPRAQGVGPVVQP